MVDTAPGDTEMGDYVVGRWPVAVRTLVLLGAPPHHAVVLATRAVGRLLDGRDGWDGDGPRDPDAALTAAIVETWEQDRTPWWRHPDVLAGAPDVLAGTGVPEALDVLDTLTPSDRVRTVAGAVIGLIADQLDDLLGAATTPPHPADWATTLARVAEAVPVGRDRLDQARAQRQDRRRRRRLKILAGGLGGVVAAGLAVAVGLGGPGSPSGTPADRAGPSPSDTSGDTSGGTPGDTSTGTSGQSARDRRDLRAVAWYDGRRIHFADRTVAVPDVVAMARVGDGVVATDRQGRVLHVRALGGVEPLGRTPPGRAATADAPTSRAAWIEARTGAVVVRALESEAAAVSVPVRRARIVAIDRRTVYVAAPDAPSRALPDGLTIVPAPADLVDVAGGAQLRQSAPGRVAVVVGHDLVQNVPGGDGVLSDDGAYLITRDTGPDRDPTGVVDLSTGAVLDFDLAPTGLVRDAAFDGDTVSFVLEDPHGIQYPPDRPRSRGYLTGWSLVVCDLAGVACHEEVTLFGDDARPILAR